MNLREMFGLRVPIISVVIGEGGSGGALAIGALLGWTGWGAVWLGKCIGCEGAPAARWPSVRQGAVIEMLARCPGFLCRMLVPDGKAWVRQACFALVCCGGGLVVPSACV